MDEVKNILYRYTRDIPETIIGVERLAYLLKRMKELTVDEKSVLIKFFNKILLEMRERNASDIEVGGFGCSNTIWMRIHGNKARVEDIPKFEPDEASFLILTLLTANQHKHLLVNKNLDFSYTIKTGDKTYRHRADAYLEMDTLALNMRAISSDIRPLETLEFHKGAIKSMSHKYIKFGLSLITGITGSGKSSTLDSIIDYHNKFAQAHVVIIASPIEYVHNSNKCIIRHREVGRDVSGFKEGVVESLRQDPDIIVIGEMRDPDTIMACLEVTDTGHKVFSTLHTSSAVESIDRIIGEVTSNEQERVRNRLADVLTSVVSQKLVPGLDGKRVLAKEVLIVNSSVRAAIKNNNTSEIYGMINQSLQHGMTTLEQDLIRLYKQKRISKENAVAYANNKTRILQLFSAT